MNNNNEFCGLRGWLIVVGIGLIVGLIRTIYEFGPLFYSIFTDGTFETLTTPGSDEYHSLWGPLLIFEAVFNSLMVFISLILIYLFCSVLF